jgi:hypothetical protein
MSLKFKRNLPTVVLLVSILSYLAIFMGDQTITSYSFDTETLRTAIQLNLSSEEMTALQMASMSQ